MIVVADTSPLNYLVRLGYVDVLHRLHDRVVIPEAVLHEMLADGAPPAVRMWAERIPAWVSVMAVEELGDFGLMRLDRGEREAIALAVRTHAGLLLVDDLPARRAARQRGIKIAGTLGILKDAADAGLLDFSGCRHRSSYARFSNDRRAGGRDAERNLARVPGGCRRWRGGRFRRIW